VLKQVATIDISEFKYKRNITPKSKLHTKKSVRFNETVGFNDTTETNSTFEPFKDDVGEEGDETLRDELFSGLPEEELQEENNISSSSNKDIFIQHQQQLLQQDEHLGSLSQSVRRQHDISIDINQELQEHNILLDDLENQLDSSDKRLTTGHRNLDYFSRKAKENGQWLTIIVLIIILVLLLIILK
jgi:syntaxin 8